ncbi:hypothetical protein NMY22_g6079 [Coprinellus aureogranulatus]|nr:hypothetical protein NMY22_g6079 [Coprinellus aureogranulatus]
MARTAFSPNAYSPTSPSFCAEVAVWCSYVAFRQFVRDIAILRSFENGNLANVLANLPCPQSYLAWVFTDEPEVLSDIPLVLSYVAPLQSPVTLLQSNIPAVLADEPVLQPCLSKIFAHLSCSHVPLFAQVLTDFAYGVALFPQVLSHLTCLFSSFSGLLASFACVQPDVSSMVTVEPSTSYAERLDQPLPGEPVLGLVGLNWPLMA